MNIFLVVQAFEAWNLDFQGLMDPPQLSNFTGILPQTIHRSISIDVAGEVNCISVMATTKDRVYTRRQIESLIADGRKIFILDGKVIKADAWLPFHPGGEKLSCIWLEEMEQSKSQHFIHQKRWFSCRNMPLAK